MGNLTFVDAPPFHTSSSEVETGNYALPAYRVLACKVVASTDVTFGPLEAGEFRGNLPGHLYRDLLASHPRQAPLAPFEDLSHDQKARRLDRAREVASEIENEIPSYPFAGEDEAARKDAFCTFVSRLNLSLDVAVVLCAGILDPYKHLAPSWYAEARAGWLDAPDSIGRELDAAAEATAKAEEVRKAAAVRAAEVARTPTKADHALFLIEVPAEKVATSEPWIRTLAESGAGVAQLPSGDVLISVNAGPLAGMDHESFEIGHGMLLSRSEARSLELLPAHWARLLPAANFTCVPFVREYIGRARAQYASSKAFPKERYDRSTPRGRRLIKVAQTFVEKNALCFGDFESERAWVELVIGIVVAGLDPDRAMDSRCAFDAIRAGLERAKISRRPPMPDGWHDEHFMITEENGKVPMNRTWEQYRASMEHDVDVTKYIPAIERAALGGLGSLVAPGSFAHLADGEEAEAHAPPAPTEGPDPWIACLAGVVQGRAFVERAELVAALVAHGLALHESAWTNAEHRRLRTSLEAIGVRQHKKRIGGELRRVFSALASAF
jgi:hypothetical protein